jgi:hypothetical protein
VDFEHVYRRGERLSPARLSYKVRHKSQLKGKREVAAFWKYGVELAYLEDDLVTHTKLWLCRQCHLSRQTNDAKVINGTARVVEHLKKVHKIDPTTGLLPITPVKSSSPWEVAAKSVSMAAHAPWQEEAFQAAYIDWVIVKDVSFNVAVSHETRGLLIWHRQPLLNALPTAEELAKERRGEELYHGFRKTGALPHQNEHFWIECFKLELLLQILPKRHPGPIFGLCHLRQ